jgi:type I restriction enzyme S subunit
MGEVFAYDRIQEVPCDRVPLSQSEGENSLLLPDDLLFARQSLVLSGAGKCALFVGDSEPVAFESHIIRVRLDTSRTVPAFYYYLFKSPSGRALIESIVEQGAGASGIRGSDLAGLLVPDPPFREQQRIASVLSALDDKIDLNRRMNETLEEMACALFKDWFVDFGPTKAKMEGREAYFETDLWALFPERLDGEGKPEGWHHAALDEVAFLNPESWSARSAPEQIEYVDLANTKWGVIETTAVYEWQDAPSRARRVLRPGDTIVGTVRPGNGSYAFVGQDGLTGSTGFAVLRAKQTFFQELVYCAATSEENISRLSRLADGGAYPAIRPDAVASTGICLGPDDFGKAFSTICNPLFRRIASNEVKSRTLTQIRDLLLPKLMSGEICVAEADQFVAEAL